MLKKEKTGTGRLRGVLRFGKRYTPLFLTAELCILVSYGVSLLLPLNLTRLTDQVLAGGQYGLLGPVIGAYAVLFLTAAAFNLLYAWVWQTLNNRYLVDVKNALFEKSVRSRPSILTGRNTGDVMSRIDVDSEQFLHVIQRNLFHFVNSALLCAGILLMVARISLWLALLLMAAALLPILLTRLNGRLTERVARASRETTGRFSGRLFEILKGMREIRLLGAEVWAADNVIGPLKTLVRLGNRSRRVDFLAEREISLVHLLTSLTVYALSAYLIVQGRMTVGQFLAAIEYMALLHRKMNWMLRIWLDWYWRKVSLDRVNEILESGEEPSGVLPADGSVETLVFEHVDFSYGETPVLRDVSFTVRRGEHVAIVGASGVGKSTIAEMMLRFYDPTSGRVLVNGADVRQYRLGAYRRRFGFVGQDVLLFDETLRYNLLLGCEEDAAGGRTDRDLLAVCERVGLGDFVRALPEGLDTRLGGTAHGLSGGQKQRVMIARALLQDADVLILDEATSALDVEIEETLWDALTEQEIGRTMVVISHRLKTIRECSRILVLHEGRIAGEGTHQELLRDNAVYRSLFGENTAEPPPGRAAREQAVAGGR